LGQATYENRLRPEKAAKVLRIIVPYCGGLFESLTLCSTRVRRFSLPRCLAGTCTVSEGWRWSVSTIWGTTQSSGSVFSYRSRGGIRARRYQSIASSYGSSILRQYNPYLVSLLGVDANLQGTLHGLRVQTLLECRRSPVHFRGKCVFFFGIIWPTSFLCSRILKASR
jgi:hypothetical protein